MEKPAQAVDNWRTSVDNFEGGLVRGYRGRVRQAMVHDQGWLVHHSRQSYPHHAKVINGNPGVINNFTLTIGLPSPRERGAGGEG